jgi:hypothetical protein
VKRKNWIPKFERNALSAKGGPAFGGHARRATISMLKRFLFSIAAVVLGLLGIFLVNEIFFRIFRGAPPSAQQHLAQTTRQSGQYLFTPNTVHKKNTTPFHEFVHDTHFNKYGYRGKDFVMPKPPGVIRVFAI